MKFCIVCDTHLGDDSVLNGIVKIWGSRVIKNLKQVMDLLQREPDLRFAIQLGDAIQEDKDGNLQTDRENLKNIANAFASFKSPVHHLLGNHDDVNLSAEESLNLLGMKKPFYSFDAGGLTGIALSCRSENHRFPTVPDEQLQWLEHTLRKSKKSALVFVHQALADQSLEKNFWFKEKPESALIANRKAVIEILERCGKVLAVFNGHLHCNNFTRIGKIPFFTIQSFSQVVDESGEPATAYAVVEVTEGKGVRVEIFGRDSQVFEA